MFPNSSQVKSALLAKKGEEKVDGYLGKYIDGKKCLCIEGLFCEVAVKLGFEGKFLERKINGEKDEKAFHLNVQGAWHGGWAPIEVFKFLGISRKVSYNEIKAAGFELREGIDAKLKSIDYINWHTLNDDTDLTLDDLIDLAVKQLP